MANLLEISNLSKRYGSNLALDDISLTIEKPTAIGLVGKNGAGKTTLLSILSGALRANSGSIRILGESPESIATTGKLNILPQDATFKKGISIAKQLRLFARLQGASRQQADEEVKELLAELGDATFADKTVTSLSYGQRKRLGILQAFLALRTRKFLICMLSDLLVLFRSIMPALLSLSTHPLPWVLP